MDKVLQSFEMGPDEVGALTEAARTADELADLRAASKGPPMMVKRSMAQLVVHPLLAEVRRHREMPAKLLERLSLSAGDEDSGSDAGAEAGPACRSAGLAGPEHCSGSCGAGPWHGVGHPGGHGRR